MSQVGVVEVSAGRFDLVEVFVGPKGDPGSGAAATPHALAVASAGQTAFALPTVPTAAAGLILIVNGAAYTGPANVTVSGSILTWVNPSFALRPTDEVTAFYA